MLDSSIHEVWIAAKEVASVATPFAVLWLGLRAARRKTLLDTINGNLEKLDVKVDAVKESLDNKIQTSKDECQEDMKALTVQILAFQREVAENYADKREFLSAISDVRTDVRSIRGSK